MKTTLITGASSGIGKETAFVFAENNHNLILVARRIENLEKIKQEIESKNKVSVTVIGMDLSKLDSAENLYNEITNRKLPVDVLINNAGFGINGQFVDIDINREQDMLVLNIVTLTKLTKLFAKDFIKKGQGNIINIGSTASFQAVPTFSTYAASKAYVLHFTEAISVELKKHNVIATAICPGATKSEFATTANVDSKVFNKAPTARDLGKFIYKTSLKKKTIAIHGFMNKLLALTTRFSPRKLNTKIAGKVME